MNNQQKQKSEADFPNEGKFIPGEDSLNPDNYFRDHENDLIRKKYLQMTVYFEALYGVLELDKGDGFQEFGMRVRDLTYAAEKEKLKQN